MYRYSIIACARWETPYIAEWIAYYEALGFGHIYLYCNDDDPAELQAAVAAATAHNPNFVSFTHFRGQGRQTDMYVAALEVARHESEWVTFLDIDEFLVLRNCDDIYQFMEPFYDTVDSVHFCWIYFGNSGFIDRPPGSVLQQYTSRASLVNANTKHLSRTALLDPGRLFPPTHPPFWHGLPDPVWSGFRRVNVLGVDMTPMLANYPAGHSAYLANRATNQAVFDKAVINHYAMKSEADFLLRAKRGTGGQFKGQVMWKQSYESGRFRETLAAMNQVEDTYLRDYSLRKAGLDVPPSVTMEPTPPYRKIRARHALWTSDMMLGGNGRVRHADHGSLGGYTLEDGMLRVRWDNSESAEHFIEQGEQFVFIPDPVQKPRAIAVGTHRPARVLSDQVDAEEIGAKNISIGPITQQNVIAEIAQGAAEILSSLKDNNEQVPVTEIAKEPVPAMSQFTKRRVIVIKPRGLLVNRMMQYMGALSLASLIKDCSIVNVTLPEWGINIPDDTKGQRFLNNIDHNGEWFAPDFQELAALANQSESIRIVIADYLQRIDYFLSRSFYNEVFPKSQPTGYEPTKNDLVIHIRTGEILVGVAHYPLTPISFYEDIVAKTGLNPVFVGQIQPSAYVDELRRRFPGATYIGRSAKEDFDFMRSAKNILIPPSTFSWLAAWLSDARTIFLPLNGFLNPIHHRETDLLPIDDIRYRFFLFPLNYGLPDQESLVFHERLKGRWKEISRNQVGLLKSAAPFMRVRRENDSGQPARVSLVPIDDTWYAHEYIDAALEISEGWFETPLQHYLEVGRLRGYSPTRPTQDELPQDLTLPNLALHKPATQSSCSQWSVGATSEEDAANAVNGKPSSEACFHTDREQNPWWSVDLGAKALVHFIRIFNRNGASELILQRASPLVVEASNDGTQWRVLFRTQDRQIFAGYSGGRPLTWRAPRPVEARFVRISIPRVEYLHLAEVEVYGKFMDG